MRVLDTFTISEELVPHYRTETTRTLDSILLKPSCWRLNDIIQGYLNIFAPMCSTTSTQYKERDFRSYFYLSHFGEPMNSYVNNMVI